ncbi:MAG: formylglycine-generating enzyme family protein [Planctomycetes bacterium]|nr:formylglycine-generating enzyme family protein [Planctomycetota bacterium]
METARENLTRQTVAGCRIIRKGREEAYGTEFNAYDTKRSANATVFVLGPPGGDTRNLKDRIKSIRPLLRAEQTGLVPLLDVREHQGRVILVRIRYDAESLRERIERKTRLNYCQAVELGVRLARAVAGLMEGGLSVRLVHEHFLSVSTDGTIRIRDWDVPWQNQAYEPLLAGIPSLGTPESPWTSELPEDADEEIRELRKIVGGLHDELRARLETPRETPGQDDRPGLERLGVLLAVKTVFKAASFTFPKDFEGSEKQRLGLYRGMLQTMGEVISYEGIALSAEMKRRFEELRKGYKEFVKSTAINIGTLAIKFASGGEGSGENFAGLREKMIRERIAMPIGKIAGLLGALLLVIALQLYIAFGLQTSDPLQETEIRMQVMEKKFDEALMFVSEWRPRHEDDPLWRKMEEHIEIARHNHYLSEHDIDGALAFAEAWIERTPDSPKAKEIVGNLRSKIDEIEGIASRLWLLIRYRQTDEAENLYRSCDQLFQWNPRLANANEAIEFFARTEGMIFIPGGFIDAPEGEKRFVRGFFIDRTEVSRKDFALFIRGRDMVAPPSLQTSGGELLNPNFPMEGISFDQAQLYASITAGAGARLPTIDEWTRATFLADAGENAPADLGVTDPHRSYFGAEYLTSSLFEWSVDVPESTLNAQEISPDPENYRLILGVPAESERPRIQRRSEGAEDIGFRRVLEAASLQFPESESVALGGALQDRAGKLIEAILAKPLAEALIGFVPADKLRTIEEKDSVNRFLGLGSDDRIASVSSLRIISRPLPESYFLATRLDLRIAASIESGGATRTEEYEFSQVWSREKDEFHLVDGYRLE